MNEVTINLNFEDEGVADAPELIPDELAQEWEDAKAQLKELQATELRIRNSIVNTFFAGKSEGTHSMKTDKGRTVAVTIVINRSVDPGSLLTYSEQLFEAGIVPDVMIRTKPELVVSNYRLLNEQQKMVFDQVLTIKDGTPQMEVRTPKAKGKK